MPLDPEFKKHLHSLMVEVYNNTIEENEQFKRERIGQARHSPSAYTDAALHATENRIGKTIAKYLEAVSIWGFEITPSFEKDMISEFQMLTAGPNQNTASTNDSRHPNQRRSGALRTGTLEACVYKHGRPIQRRLSSDRTYLDPTGEPLVLKGRALMMARNVGMLMSRKKGTK